MADDNPTMTEAARRFAQSLPPARHQESQEALRFARWFGEDRPATDIRPSDLETYVDTYGATAPNAVARADALKGFLAYVHKQGICRSAWLVTFACAGRNRALAAEHRR